jgi:DNA invertase Pin-like site-specific DNA recombinase
LTAVATFCAAAISGAAIASRPGLRAMLAAAADATFDVLLVEDTDRFEPSSRPFARLWSASTSSLMRQLATVCSST